MCPNLHRVAPAARTVGHLATARPVGANHCQYLSGNQLLPGPLSEPGPLFDQTLSVKNRLPKLQGYVAQFLGESQPAAPRYTLLIRLCRCIVQAQLSHAIRNQWLLVKGQPQRRTHGSPAHEQSTTLLTRRGLPFPGAPSLVPKNGAKMRQTRWGMPRCTTTMLTRPSRTTSTTMYTNITTRFRSTSSTNCRRRMRRSPRTRRQLPMRRRREHMRRQHSPCMWHQNGGGGWGGYEDSAKSTFGNTSDCPPPTCSHPSTSPTGCAGCAETICVATYRVGGIPVGTCCVGGVSVATWHARSLPCSVACKSWMHFVLPNLFVCSISDLFHFIFFFILKSMVYHPTARGYWNNLLMSMERPRCRTRHVGRLPAATCWCCLILLPRNFWTGTCVLRSVQVCSVTQHPP